MKNETSPYAELDPEEWQSTPHGYDTARVCENGHVINEHACQDPIENADYCERCGSCAVSECSCGSPIRGAYYGTRGFFKPPAYCLKCGKPHIWTSRRIEAFRELVAELEDLGEDDREKLLTSIPDLVAENPRTDTAIIRIKRVLSNVPPEMGKLLLSKMADFAMQSVLTKFGFGTPG